jgi:hypothetical protein
MAKPLSRCHSLVTRMPVLPESQDHEAAPRRRAAHPRPHVEVLPHPHQHCGAPAYISGGFHAPFDRCGPVHQMGRGIAARGNDSGGVSRHIYSQMDCAVRSTYPFDIRQRRAIHFVLLGRHHVTAWHFAQAHHRFSPSEQRCSRAVSLPLEGFPAPEASWQRLAQPSPVGATRPAGGAMRGFRCFGGRACVWRTAHPPGPPHQHRPAAAGKFRPAVTVWRPLCCTSSPCTAGGPLFAFTT